MPIQVPIQLLFYLLLISLALATLISGRAAWLDFRARRWIWGGLATVSAVACLAVFIEAVKLLLPLAIDSF